MSNEPAKLEVSDIDERAEKHALLRSSAKGMTFVGVCVLCGEEGLPIMAARAPCTNPDGLTQRQAFQRMLELLENEDD